MEQEIQRLCNRHLAQLLTKLDQIDTPEIIKDSIKQQFNWLQSDLKINLSERSEAGKWDRKKVF